MSTSHSTDSRGSPSLGSNGGLSAPARTAQLLGAVSGLAGLNGLVGSNGTSGQLGGVLTGAPGISALQAAGMQTQAAGSQISPGTAGSQPHIYPWMRKVHTGQNKQSKCKRK